MKYNIKKLTVKNRVTIPVGAVVEIEVNENVEISIIKSIDKMSYGKFFLRKKFAKQGLIQMVHSPFPQGYIGKPLIVIKNDAVCDIELREGDIIGSVWIFC